MSTLLAFVLGALTAAIVAYVLHRSGRAALLAAQKEASHAAEVARALTDKQRQLNALVSAWPDTLMRLDARRRIVELKMADPHGESSPLIKVGGRPLDSMFEGPVAERIGAAVERCAKGSAHEMLEFELRMRRELRQFEARITSEGESGTLVVFRDVTEQKVTRAALQHAREVAEADARARTEFLARMSHDLRNPMTGVLGMADLLLRRESDPRRRSHLEIIQRAGGYFVSIVDDILSFSRAEQGKLVLEGAPTDVEALVADVLELAEGDAAQKQIELYLGVSPGVARTYRLDPLRVRQIVGNLVGNAVRFTDRGHVLVRLAAGDEALELTVEDTGVGIPDEAKESIFDPFVQSGSAGERRAGGAGLGLAVCKQLVSLMHGTIDVESRSGEGSRFVVRLPVPALEPPPRLSAPESVLLCIGDVLARKVVAGALERLGVASSAIPDLEALDLRIDAARGHELRVFVDEIFGSLDAGGTCARLSRPGVMPIVVASTLSVDDVPFCPAGHRALRHPLRTDALLACLRAPSDRT